jgi:DNA-directed RNA polymerase alpha subunit
MIKGQELELEARAILGIGKDHMKWSPGIVYFKNMLSLDIKDKADVEKIKKKVPENVGLKFSGSKISVDEDKLALSSFFDAYANEEAIDGIKVTLVPDNFIFNVESFGQLSVKEMVQKGIEILQEKLNELNDKISK